MTQRWTPSWKQGFARSQAESAFPNLWTNLRGLWAPALGPTGVQLFDVSGQRNHGAITDMDPATDWVPGDPRVGGYALEFVANQDNRVIIPVGNDALNISGDFAIVALINPGVIAENDYVFHHVGGAGEGFDGYSLDFTNSDGLRFYDGQNFINGDNNTLSVGTWHCVAVSIAGTAATIWVDGSPAGSGTAGSQRAFSGLAHIGAAGFDLFMYTGKIAFIAIYSRCLAPSEIQHLSRNHLAMLRRRSRFPVSVPAAPTGAIMNQFQASNLGADLFNGTLI